ncbi:unnamed protein product [Lupinus luteus]|uniref:Cotton fiber protein n=1 Tax=Lupinus luteus TaxID=3873 RepID=A0AAV1XJ66_LUPLU
MVVNSPVIAKRLWNVLRVTFFMTKKGLISKRKVIIDMNLMMKKGKFLRKSMRNLMHHNHQHAKNLARGGYGIQEYEFSCSNSPNPVFFHVPKRKHHFTFPCIKSNEVVEDESDELDAFEGYCEENKAIVLVPKTPENVFNIGFDVSEFEENEESGKGEVDEQAEDFIRRFYEQLRMQSQMQLLQYQNM